MLLSRIESTFVRILRSTVIATAFISMLVVVGGLLYAGVVYVQPEPKANLARQAPEIRAAVDPQKLFETLFPKDSAILKELRSEGNGVAYAPRNATDSELFAEFNMFLDVLLGGAFEDEEQFKQWLYGEQGLELRWSKAIDNEAASNDDNVNVLWRSLLLDYAKRLTAHGRALGEYRKKGMFPTSFNRLTSPSGRAQAPYLLAWFFEALQRELGTASEELATAKLQWEMRGTSILMALSTAAAAFGYFILIMFMFLLVSIEASVRTIAGDENKSSSGLADSGAAKPA